MEVVIFSENVENWRVIVKHKGKCLVDITIPIKEGEEKA